LRPTDARKQKKLLDGFEIVPRKRIEYKGCTLEEMDLDAIIARRPQLILVDEIAHENAPGSRHQKRYLDIEELLGRGIDVYTTVNIQHLESLNDVIAQITGVRMRATVPDFMFDRADAVELVDLTPDDLIKRLHEGKIYTPPQAERALQRYFLPENLTALRELALRRIAERVDEQLLSQLQARAIPGPWAAGERILVCINENPRSAGLVRYAQRLSARLHAPFTALFVEGHRAHKLDEVERDRIASTLRLAHTLGGEAVTLPGGGKHAADDVLSYARANNVTQILLGQSSRSRWSVLLHGSMVHELMRTAGNIGIHVIAGEDIKGEPIPRKNISTSREPFHPRPYLLALLAVALGVVVAEAIQPWSGAGNVGLILLTAILAIAVRYGLYPSLFASIVASLCYNFFFLPPVYTLTITDPSTAAALVLFIIIGVIVSNLAAQARQQANAAINRARTTEALYSFSRTLAGAATTDDLLSANAYQIALMLKVCVVILLPEKQSIVLKRSYPPDQKLDDSDIAAAKWAWEHNRPAGRGSDTLPAARNLFLPMRTGRRAVGVIGISNDKRGPLLTPDEQRLLDALLDQSALAIERQHLVSRPWPMRSLS
jgi:two-component system sensor histidine kinase KdpD